MKRNILMLGLTLSFFAAGSVWARGSGDQGIGLTLGSPTGFTMKMWLNEDTAIDGLLGIDQGELDIHATFLYHNNELSKRIGLVKAGSKAYVPIYYGIGPRILFDSDTEFGVRLPVGVACLPNDTPWEFFAELAPIIRLTPSVGVDANYNIGARYYFDAIRPR